MHMDDVVRRIVERFGLVPHPEGGYFREVYRSPLEQRHPGIPSGIAAERTAGTLIYYLLSGRDFSAFHRVRFSDEIWHLYAGGPLDLSLIDASGQLERRRLTGKIEEGEPATVVSAATWQSARLADGAAWAFCGCTVAPGFDYDDFEMPTADLLLRRFPQHADTIRSLTRRFVTT
jgi:predicted cupin superfamily sugar epimerase